MLKTKWLKWGVAVLAIGALSMTATQWWPLVTRTADMITKRARTAATADAHHDAHDEHAHEDHASSANDSLELSPQARANLGLTVDYLRPVELATYRRTISIPALISPRPGRSHIVVSSPLAGVVTHVHAVPGEAVTPGQLLFEVRLTYEDLVDTQTQYLKSISELAVENREIARLEQATQTGALSGKALLERRYAKDKLEASLRSQREALRLHGLSDRQIDDIGREGRLLRDLQIVAPDIDRHDQHEELRLTRNPIRPISYANPDARTPPLETTLVIEDLQVHKGQSVVAGDKLCSLSDLSQLYIEGKAFEQDVPAMMQLAQRGWSVTASLPDINGKAETPDLKLAFVGNSIDPTTRTLPVYVELPNMIVSDQVNDAGQRFINWKYRLGQRLELQVPVEEWRDKFVLPVDAVAKDGADWYVFAQNGSFFERLPVHVLYRDGTTAVVAHDGSIFPGDIIAGRSAHQLQMAIKNKAGGGVDPHAGHNH